MTARRYRERWKFRRRKNGRFGISVLFILRDDAQNPPLIAKEIAEKFSDDSVLDRCEAAGGYVNFFFNPRTVYFRYGKAVSAAGESWGSSDIGGGSRLVEYSSPNIAKAVPYRTFVSTAVGNSLARI